MIAIDKVLKGISSIDASMSKHIVKGITNNSCEVKEGFIFFAFQGDKFDGNNFIKEAFKNGAILAITDSKKIDIRQNIIKVEDLNDAAAKVCSNFYNFPQKKIKLIGVTGTNGKTSTTLILKSILEAANKKAIQIGTLGVNPKIKELSTNLTTPNIFELFKILHCAIENKFEYAILEVSSHALAQKRIFGLKFDVTAFTNLSLDHLDYHQTIDNYFKEKLKLFSMNKKNGSSVVLVDSEYGQKISYLKPSINQVSFKNKNVKYFCRNVELGNEEIKGIMTCKSKKIDIQSKLMGRFNLENIVLAAAISFELNIPEKSIEKGIKNCSSIDGRMHIVENLGDYKILLDYGHTPDAYFKALEAVKEKYKLPIKVLFGAGGGRDHSKRSKMAEVVEKYSLECYLAPDNPRYESIDAINADVIKGFSNNNYHCFDDREKALKFALSNLLTNEILIIFGKGNEEYQEIEGVKYFYSDKKIIKKFYAH